jgi:hypothetical protein
MLEEIAKNDYGDDFAEHLAAIEAQLGNRPPLGLLPWHPLEVLELERWTRPDCVREHLKRLLACSILLRNVGYIPDRSETNFVQESASTLLRLTESAIALEKPRARRAGNQRRRDHSDDVSHIALRFLLWVHSRQPHPEFRPFVSFCIFLLAAQVNLGNGSGEDLRILGNWVEYEEAQCREVLGHNVSSERWLIGLNEWEDCAEHREKWAESAARILGQMHDGRTTKVHASLSSLSDRLADL